jgi:hypothetical protein
MGEAKVNYTEDQVAKLVKMYDELGNDGLDEIAKEMDKPVRSIRSKLSHLGVYIKQDKPASTAKREGPTKKEMLRELQSLVGFDVIGLSAATKTAIQGIIDFAHSVQADEAETEDEADAA